MHDEEALSVANATLSDESLQSAPAGTATSQASAPAPAQADKPATADTAASAPAQEPKAGDDQPQDSAQAQPQDTPEKPKFKGGFQKRIDELTRGKYEAERRAQFLEQQLRTTQAAPPPQQEKPAPKIEDFQDINEFFAARDQWVEERAVSRLRQEQQASQRQSQQEQQQHESAIQLHQKVERFKASEADATERYADYDAVAASPHMQQLRMVRGDIAAAVIDSDHGADIVYYLGKNPQVAQQLAQLPSIAAAREIGRIEQMFMSPKPQASNAPPPPKAVGGNAQVERRPEDMSVPELRRWYAQRAKS